MNDAIHFGTSRLSLSREKRPRSESLLSDLHHMYTTDRNESFVNGTKALSFIISRTPKGNTRPTQFSKATLNRHKSTVKVIDYLGRLKAANAVPIKEPLVFPVKFAIHCGRWTVPVVPVVDLQ